MTQFWTGGDIIGSSPPKGDDFAKKMAKRHEFDIKPDWSERKRRVKRSEDPLRIEHKPAMPPQKEVQGADGTIEQSFKATEQERAANPIMATIASNRTSIDNLIAGIDKIDEQSMKSLLIYQTSLLEKYFRWRWDSMKRFLSEEELRTVEYELARVNKLVNDNIRKFWLVSLEDSGDS